ncbi:MAG: hypothetical protein OHK0013_05580 [Sandaracinaceae bacterium]
MASRSMASKEAASALYCWRCDDLVRAVRPWPHWRKVWIAWCAAIGVIAILSPIMGADYFCMIPTMMGIIVAGGPIYRYATEKPTCSVCSAEIDPTRAHGTGVRVRPRARSGGLP